MSNRRASCSRELTPHEALRILPREPPRIPADCRRGISRPGGIAYPGHRVRGRNSRGIRGRISRSIRRRLQDAFLYNPREFLRAGRVRVHAVGQKPCGRIELRMQVDNLHALPGRDFLDDGVYLVHDCGIHDSPPAVVGIGLQRRDDPRACREVHEGVEQRFVILVQLFLLVLPVVVVVLGLSVLDAVVREELAVVCPELYDDYLGVKLEGRLELVGVPVAHVVARALVRERHGRNAEVLHLVAIAQHLLQPERVVFLPAEPVARGDAVAYARHARLCACGACNSRDCHQSNRQSLAILSKHHAYNINSRAPVRRTGWAVLQIAGARQSTKNDPRSRAVYQIACRVAELAAFSANISASARRGIPLRRSCAAGCLPRA